MTDTALIGPVDPPLLHVMSYNIRRRVPHMMRRNHDRWNVRKPLIRRMLTRELPALLGVQEALFDQAEFLQEALGPQYREIGYGRDRDRGGERCPIFWDSTRLRLETWNQKALSDTPDASGSRSWGNRDPRLFVSAEFTDLTTGLRFLAINTHFDHRSSKARERSAEAIRAVVSATALPCVVMGDFNSDAGSLAHRTLTADGAVRDSWIAAQERLTEPWGTYPNYRRPRVGRKRIDWILVTPTIEVVSAAINVRRMSGKWPSDHAPVQAVVRFGEAD